MKRVIKRHYLQYLDGYPEAQYKVCVDRFRFPISKAKSHDVMYVVYKNPTFTGIFDASMGYTAARYRGGMPLWPFCCDRSLIRVKPLGITGHPYKVSYEFENGSKTPFLHILHTNYVFCYSIEDAHYVRESLLEGRSTWERIIARLLDRFSPIL